MNFAWVLGCCGDGNKTNRLTGVNQPTHQLIIGDNITNDTPTLHDRVHLSQDESQVHRQECRPAREQIHRRGNGRNPTRHGIRRHRYPDNQHTKTTRLPKTPASRIRIRVLTVKVE